MRILVHAIKAEVRDPGAETITFNTQKTMNGGKQIARGDTIFVFSSENIAGSGLIACAIVTSAEAILRTPGTARQTPRPGKRRGQANAAGEHHHPAFSPREAALGAERAQTDFRLKRCST